MHLHVIGWISGIGQKLFFFVDEIIQLGTVQRPAGIVALHAACDLLQREGADLPLTFCNCRDSGVDLLDTGSLTSVVLRLSAVIFPHEGIVLRIF